MILANPNEHEQNDYDFTQYLLTSLWLCMSHLTFRLFSASFIGLSSQSEQPGQTTWLDQENHSMLAMLPPGLVDNNDAFHSAKNSATLGATLDVESLEGQANVRNEVRQETRSRDASESSWRERLCCRCISTPISRFHRGRAGTGNEVKLEELTIRRLKCMVFGALIVATVVITVVFYQYATAKEQDAFRRKASDNGLKVLEAIGTSIHTTMGSIDSFVVSASVRFYNFRCPLPDWYTAICCDVLTSHVVC
jgi:hypothetical protein